MNTILAIQPESRQIGYAVFEGRALIDWGSKDLTSKPIGERNEIFAAPLFERLIHRFEPDVLVVPKPTRTSGSVRNLMLRMVHRAVNTYAFGVVSYSLTDIVSAFKDRIGDARPNKDNIRAVIVREFPELGGLQPRPRGRSDPEDFRVPMFDAIALAITFLTQQE
ncbi:MAG TPA: hypothetical protein VGK48_09605 [Terriglobia bacterium]|jgi:hypothetical protein